MEREEFEIMNLQGDSHWWYGARRELLRLELEKIGSESRDLKILDLASACGDNFSLCSNYGRPFGLDISWQAIEYCREKNISSITQGDAQKLPFKSGVYDVVLALDVFEHLEDDIESMIEIERVLKENGRLIFNTPAFMSLYSYHDAAFHHYRRYRKNELITKFSAAKLQINTATYWSFFIFPLVFLVRKLTYIRRRDSKEARSDFHRQINPIVDLFLRFLFGIELFLIKHNVSLPFGVSIYGTAQKSSFKRQV